MLHCLKVYPNPVGELAIFELENIDNTNLTFKLFDVMGLIQTVENFSGTSNRLYRNELKSGLYYFQIEDAEKLVVTGKLIVQ